MHPMTRAVAKTADWLEFQQFRFPEDRDDINDVRALAMKQVADDTETMARHRKGGVDRVGREWVQHVGQEFAGETLWKRWEPDQVALEAGMAVYLNRLSDRQREVIRLRYAGRLSVHQTALVLGVTKSTAQTYEARAIELLGRALRKAFVEEDAA